MEEAWGGVRSSISNVGGAGEDGGGEGSHTSRESGFESDELVEGGGSEGRRSQGHVYGGTAISMLLARVEEG